MNLNNICTGKLRDAVKESTNFTDLCKRLNIINKGGRGYNTIQQRLDMDKIDYTHFSYKQQTKVQQYTDAELFALDTGIPKTTVRYRLKKRKQYICSECGLNEWRNKHISLQMDHINGNHNDDRIDNLRWLCPNCHSQTDTYAGRGIKNKNSTDLIKRAKDHLDKVYAYQASIQHRIKLVTTSNIDYTIFGWGTKLSQIFNCTPQATLKWVKKNMPEFYKNTCYKTTQLYQYK